MALLHMFYPDRWYDSAYVIPYETLYAQGFRTVLYDIDNTLVPHGAPADDRAAALFARLREIGFSTCLISNNQLPRVAPFAEAVGSEYLVDAHKPSPKGYREACMRLGAETGQAVFIGDQIFTDIWGARRAGLSAFLVQPIHPKEEIQIILKRRLEWIVLWSYRRVMKRHGIKSFPRGHFQQTASLHHQKKR